MSGTLVFVLWRSKLHFITGLLSPKRAQPTTYGAYTIPPIPIPPPLSSNPSNPGSAQKPPNLSISKASSLSTWAARGPPTQPSLCPKPNSTIHSSSPKKNPSQRDNRTGNPDLMWTFPIFGPKFLNRMPAPLIKASSGNYTLEPSPPTNQSIVPTVNPL